MIPGMRAGNAELWRAVGELRPSSLRRLTHPGDRCGPRSMDSQHDSAAAYRFASRVALEEVRIAGSIFVTRESIEEFIRGCNSQQDNAA